jgi:hypothetical protein
MEEQDEAAEASNTEPSRVPITNRAKGALRALTAWIPIIGRLWQCEKAHLKEAFYEVGCVVLFSTLPLWFFPLISWFLFTVGFSIGETVANGELLIYAASFSGTMVYFISKRYGTFQTHTEAGEGPPLAISISFPYGGLFVIVSALICMFAAAGFFVLKSFTRLPPQDNVVLSLSGLSHLSWGLFVVSTALFYCAVAYRNMLDQSPGFRLPPERDVMADWNKAK